MRATGEGISLLFNVRQPSVLPVMEKTLKTLEAFGNRYIQTHLGHWVKRSDVMKRDWFAALDFFLSRVYYQGRRDKLSDVYYEAAQAALLKYFGKKAATRDRKYNIAWSKGFIPHDPDWERLARKDNPLWKGLVANKAGKERDMEMVMDILRFIQGCPVKNIVFYSLSEIAKGKMVELYDELDSIWQVGEKVASFYLRDLAFIYDLKLSSKAFITIQPIDTWVKQVTFQIGLCSKRDSHRTIVSKLLKACEKAKVDPKKVNAGAWYIGANSFKLLLDFISN